MPRLRAKVHVVLDGDDLQVVFTSGCDAAGCYMIALWR